jgi:hypothetical protein
LIVLSRPPGRSAISFADCGGASRALARAAAVFLCIFGLVLTLATAVEALAPFIYAIF